MKTSHHDKQANARRVLQSGASKRNAADVFRHRHIDSTLKRILNRYEQTHQTVNTDSPSPESDRGTQTSGADTEAGQAS